MNLRHELKRGIEYMLNNDELSHEEAGFMMGYYAGDE